MAIARGGSRKTDAARSKWAGNAVGEFVVVPNRRAPDRSLNAEPVHCKCSTMTATDANMRRCAAVMTTPVRVFKISRRRPELRDPISVNGARPEGIRRAASGEWTCSLREAVRSTKPCVALLHALTRRAFPTRSSGAWQLMLIAMMRTTPCDVDFLLSALQGLNALLRIVASGEFDPVPGRPRRFVDRITGVSFDVLRTGLFPGSGSRDFPGKGCQLRNRSVEPWGMEVRERQTLVQHEA